MVVGLSIVGTSALAAFGVIGDGNPPEKFDTWQTVIEPAGGDALRITETFDQDFGDNRRHGPQRDIPNDFGTPTDVVASSPSAPDAVTAIDEGFQTIVRIGDPDQTVTGQHRYTLAYTLPRANVSSGFLAIDAFAPDEFETDLAEVVVRGFELANPRCFVGFNGSDTPCDFVDDGGVYRATFESLPKFTGITVDGEIVGTTDLVDVAPLPLPERRPDNRLVLSLAVAVLGVIAAVAVYLWARHRGRNEVFAGGAADAAFGELPPPDPGGTGADAVATSFVPDDRMDELATIEFVPPKGVTPWEGAVLLDEHLDDRTVQAWLSGLAGRDAITLDERNGNLAIGVGPRRNELDAVDRSLLDRVLNGNDPYVTGSYDPVFAKAWSKIAEMQRQRIADSGWWKQLPPGAGLTGRGGSSRSASVLIAIGVFFLLFAASAVTTLLGAFASWPAALLLGLLFPAIVAYFMYRVLLPARSAQGSALALRTESFRRFLHASEAKHVEWAWEHDLLREYSGWAVALGEADAWSAALERANVPEPARASAMPALLVARSSSSLASSRTAPSSSGSGGSSGGFSGGSVGGGGGGGSRGSW